MNAKFKQTIGYVGVVAVLFLGSTAYAQPFGDVPKRAMRHREERMKNLNKELELTAEQQGQIKKQRNEQRKKNKQLGDKLRVKKTQLREELEKQDIDKSKVSGLVAEIKTLLGNQLEQRVENVLSMKEMLTPEQFKKLQEKRTENKRNRQIQRNTQRSGRRDGRGGEFRGFE